jgi:hypothetical protein
MAAHRSIDMSATSCFGPDEMTPPQMLLNPFGLTLSQPPQDAWLCGKIVPDQRFAHLIANRCHGQFLDRVLILGGLRRVELTWSLAKSTTWKRPGPRKFLDRVLIEAPGAAPESEKPR